MSAAQPTDNTWQVRNPRTGKFDFSFHPATPDVVASAVERIRIGQEDWSASGPEGRAAALRAFADAIDSRRQELLDALVADTGRYRIAGVEVDNVRFIIERSILFAEKLFATEPEREATIPGLFGHTQLVPYPVVGIISPWNFPVLLAMVDAVPALAAGCGVLLKPSEVTPRHAEVLNSCLQSVPALASVTDMVMGPGTTGAAVIDEVDAVAFTGSVKTGRIVGERAAANFIPAFLEMGGNDPAIVLPSADLDRAVGVILRASVAATGQACQSVERVYVHESIHDDFVARLTAAAENVTLNSESLTRGHIGPLIFEKQAAIIQAHVDDAVTRGATLVTGGRAVENGGIWYPPTILTDATHEMAVMREETFGPVIPIMRFSSTEDAIRLANATDYGLSANVFGTDESETLAVARRLDGGVVSINEASLSSMVHEFEQEPFKLSGLGRSRMGPAGVERYCRKKLIIADRGDAIRSVEDYCEPDT
jgi:acyl-CoA reductase-like NAD-dependent aldehyde dehydrogenase